MPTTAALTFTGLRLIPVCAPQLAVSLPVKLAASKNFARGTVLGELIGSNSKQKLVPSTGANAITGGTFTITFGGQTTAAIPAVATAAEIQVALEALSSIGAGNILVTGGPIMSSDVFLEFVGALGAGARATVTYTSSLTSGGTAAITISSVVTGAAGTPGVFDAYNKGLTTGVQNPLCVLEYDCQTDASGNVTYSDTSGLITGEFGQTYPYAQAYFSGWFATADLVGLDVNCLSKGFDLKQGNLTLGTVRL